MGTIEVSAVWQIVGVAVGVFVIVVVALWLYNRREGRRKIAISLANLMRKAHLDWIAEVFDMYAVGDYSGLFHKVRELVKMMTDEKRLMDALFKVALKVCEYAAEHDPGMAAKLAAKLGFKAAKETPVQAA